jgi:flavodoxin
MTSDVNSTAVAPTTVLVVFGSKRGGTAGLAKMIGDALAAAGCRVVVTPAREARDVTGVDAVAPLSPAADAPAPAAAAR